MMTSLLRPVSVGAPLQKWWVPNTGIITWVLSGGAVPDDSVVVESALVSLWPSLSSPSASSTGNCHDDLTEWNVFSITGPL